MAFKRGSAVTLDEFRERFWGWVLRGESHDCWPWAASLDTHGYGQTHYPKNWTGFYIRESAHRLAYAFANPESDGDGVVMHSCDNPPCCNPAHLSLGTQAENLLDCLNKGRRNMERT